MKRLMAAVALVAALAAPAPALAWWNGDWNFRKEITLDLSPAGADVKGGAADVPVLVRLSIANFEFWSDAKPDGSDVRFMLGDDKTPLKFHIERWDATNQMAYLWVQVPRLTGGAGTDKIYMYYGNPSAPNGSEPAATYDKSQVLVYHFAEETGGPKDATAYGTNPSASAAEHVPAALIAGGASVGPGKTITVPVNNALWFPNAGITISSWVRVYVAQQDAYLVAIEGGGRTLALGLRGMQPFARLTGGAEVVATGSLTSGSWHHVALRVGEGKLTLFLDGVEAGSGPADLKELSGTMTIGGAAAGTNTMLGEVDEFQVASAARSNDWILAAARSQGVDAKLVVYGGDAQKESGGQSYFATIAKNLTVDGWVVIVICMVMLVIALILIVAKALYLSAVEKANAAFLEHYHKTRDDIGGFDRAVKDDGPFAKSTLYQLYFDGIAELSKRFSPSTVGAQSATVLSPQSIEAIRAAIDATSTRLQQRLSSKMVLLTIAISGGPFLGLLGTVIGVMITFAAIALSGDVNVNAIAPGTAAALAATVAGLAVAIPSLFGYNWLNTRIKSITADNRVFVDEFVARLAEQYS
jgi:biopolymer transport protein ExbB